MKTGLSVEAKNLLKEIIKKHLGTTKNPIIYLYGSRAKGNYRKYSDIDILLVADEYDRASLSKIDFRDTDLPYKVDFILEPDIYGPYRDEILASKIEL